MNRVVEEQGQDVELAATLLPWGSATIFQLAPPTQPAVTVAVTVELTRIVPLGRVQVTTHPRTVVETV